MDKYKGMTVEAALQTQATFRTDELVSILGRSSRSFHLLDSDLSIDLQFYTYTLITPESLYISH